MGTLEHLSRACLNGSELEETVAELTKLDRGNGVAELRSAAAVGFQQHRENIGEAVGRYPLQRHAPAGPVPVP